LPSFTYIYCKRMMHMRHKRRYYSNSEYVRRWTYFRLGQKIIDLVLDLLLAPALFEYFAQKPADGLNLLDAHRSCGSPDSTPMHGRLRTCTRRGQRLAASSSPRLPGDRTLDTNTKWTNRWWTSPASTNSPGSPYLVFGRG